MTKKLVLVLLFVSTGAALYAQHVETFYTSEGTYIGIIYFSGNGSGIGQELYEQALQYMRKEKGYSVRTDVKLTKAQWECIGKLLSRYDTVKGDTFSIALAWENENIAGACFVEFTSNTKYNYLCFSAVDPTRF